MPPLCGLFCCSMIVGGRGLTTPPRAPLSVVLTVTEMAVTAVVVGRQAPIGVRARSCARAMVVVLSPAIVSANARSSAEAFARLRWQLAGESRAKAPAPSRSARLLALGRCHRDDIPLQRPVFGRLCLVVAIWNYGTPWPLGVVGLYI